MVTGDFSKNWCSEQGRAQSSRGWKQVGENGMGGVDSSARSMTRNEVRRDSGWLEGDFLKDRAICSHLNAHMMEPT